MFFSKYLCYEKLRLTIGWNPENSEINKLFLLYMFYLIY